MGKKLKTVRKKKSDRINWKAIWKNQDRWFMEGEANGRDNIWEEQQEHIEKLVEAQLRRRKK